MNFNRLGRCFMCPNSFVESRTLTFQVKIEIWSPKLCQNLCIYCTKYLPVGLLLPSDINIPNVCSSRRTTWNQATSTNSASARRTLLGSASTLPARRSSASSPVSVHPVHPTHHASCALDATTSISAGTHQVQMAVSHNHESILSRKNSKYSLAKKKKVSRHRLSIDVTNSSFCCHLCKYKADSL